MAEEPLTGVLKLLDSLLKLFPGNKKRAELVFRYEPKDFPPCHTRIVREGRGLPWAKQMAAHTTHGGHIELKLLEAPKPSGERKRLK